jgi:SAM-dependent methyltransferase
MSDLKPGPGDRPAARDARAIERAAFAGSVFQSAIATTNILTMYMGDRLGLYGVLAEGDALSSTELARRLNLDERYLREWLEKQSVAGILTVEGDGGAELRRYRLPRPHADVLADPDHPSYLAPFIRLIVGIGRPMPRLLDAFRTGTGIPWSEYGADVREGEAGANRNMLLNQLGSEWLPRIPGVDERLLAKPSARVLDVGCGEGWASIATARAYPSVEVTGIDNDAASVARATANAEHAGVADRVKFLLMDAAEPSFSGRYDLILAFEAIHDVSRPVAVLRAMGDVAADGASVVVVELRLREKFAARPDPIEEIAYGLSVLCCLPAGRVEGDAAATGTAMRLSTLRQYAIEAGFSDVTIVPIEHFFWRFYLLVR